MKMPYDPDPTLLETLLEVGAIVVALALAVGFLVFFAGRGC